nr:TonB-dependent receptor [Hyphomonas sp. Mor2]
MYFRNIKSRKIGCNKLGLISAASMLVLSGFPAFGQDTESTSAEDEVSVQDTIYITARQRSEELSDAPLAISAYDSAALAELGNPDITSLAELTPGFSMQNNSRQNEQPFIRGMSVNSFFRDNQNASFFHDGVFVGGVARTMGSDDVQQIEVVRGPQAVYFGRQTFAGAVNFISKRPTFDYRTHARIEGAEDGRYSASGGVSGPIVDDKLAFRLYGQVGVADGAFQNTLTNDRVQEEETKGFSGSLTWRPTENGEITFRAQTVEFVDGHNTSRLLGAALNNCLPNGGGVNQAFCGEIPIPSEIALNLDTLEYPGGRRSVDQERYSLFADFDFDGYTLSSITSHNTESSVNSADGDGTPTPVFGFTFESEYEDFSQQVVLRSPENRSFRWLLGGLYFESERIESSLTFPFSFPSTPRLVENTAIFGALEYDVSDALTIALEGRFARDEIEREGTAFTETFESFLPRLTIDYQLNDDILLYGVVSQGNTPGDFNTNSGVAPENVVIDEQETWNYEAGFRKSYRDGAGLFSANVFYIDWSNQVVQENVPSAPGFPTPTVVARTNAGETEIFGIELENSIQLSDNFDARITYAYINAEYKDFISRIPLAFGGNQQVGGNKLQNTPEHMFGLIGTYRDDLSWTDGWSWFASGDLSFRSSQYLDETNTAEIPSTTLFNGRIGVENENIRVTAFGRNIFDEDTPAFATRFSDFSVSGSPGSYLLALREPAYYGLRLDFTY